MRADPPHRHPAPLPRLVWSGPPALARPVREPARPSPTPISVYGAWHCGNDAAPGPRADMANFDTNNH